MIPEAAVEAALSSLLAHYGYTAAEVSAGGSDIAEERTHGSALIATLLEAAAPHMLAEAWDKGLDWAWDGGPDMHDDNPYRTTK